MEIESHYHFVRQTAGLWDRVRVLASRFLVLTDRSSPVRHLEGVRHVDAIDCGVERRFSEERGKMSRPFVRFPHNRMTKARAIATTEALCCGLWSPVFLGGESANQLLARSGRRTL